MRSNDAVRDGIRWKLMRTPPRQEELAMRTTMLVVCLIIISAASVNAAPVYLNCQLTDSKSGEVTRINITLDEATKQVSLVLVDHGLTESTTGIFNPDTVFLSAQKVREQ